MSGKNIDISIVIVSTNIEDMLRDCLESVYRALDGIFGEVIVVDNASTDNTPNMVAREFPQVTLIKKYENHGFGENNNYGMKIARGRYVLLLNSDTLIIDRKIFKEMIAWMDAHPKVGLSSCALLNSDRKTFQGSGGYFPTLPRVFAWMTFIDDIPGVDKLMKPYHPLHPGSPFHKNEAYFKKTQKQDWVTGAFFLMRKNAMDSAGLFDEDFFLYVEEVELAYRFYKTGWESWYLPEWRIVHYGQMTNGSEKATIFEMQNLKLFYKKHYSRWQLPVLTSTLKLGAFLRILFYGLVDSKIAKIYVKAFVSI
ncbi:MAG: glycosyltransferase [Microgenomates group bacterium GW2011_GWC1_39_7b]|uniref:Glycosyltransferase n=3 Tax=Candidatus Woeseibacteriota TaxID=1752722 RepID=A0A0G0LIR8_9BACT|nr:MAG: glycosyltransferase [Candidatus Woesebacteria bacterium GW2011_GWB1_39_10]KKR26570.1 MAG: glycosyltransferase [Microgenomates group bacterium GW2011_GWC1_39_7b]KKR74392.1 MAG: glycosyltransferase [Candidatus Woesebacteria bacterium GW2011_GWA2_40_7]KKS90774.1 MAG: glycosyltransferase [Candidatus Woesebacteria bacterium GW2011_GWA1_43_12]